MKSFRTRVREEFPRGWWHSGRWWLAGLREIGTHLLATFAPLLLISGVLCAWRHREDPSQLRALDRTLEGYVGGGLLYGVGLVGLALPGVHESLGFLPVAAVITMIIWCAASSALSVWAVTIIVRSRWMHKVLWSMIDFVEENCPKNGQAPDTAEEHQACRLSASL